MTNREKFTEQILDIACGGSKIAVDKATLEPIACNSLECTDLSVAGKQAGMSKGSGTRSGLLWEVERILTEIRDSNGELPQILFMENVPQVHSQDNMPDFRK